MIARSQKRLHPASAVSFDPDHHLIRSGAAGQVLGEQPMQLADTCNPFREPAAGQPSTRLVLNLNIVMGLSPIVTNEQQPRLLARPILQSEHEGNRGTLMDQCSDGTTSHQPFDRLTTSRGTL